MDMKEKVGKVFSGLKQVQIETKFLTSNSHNLRLSPHQCIGRIGLRERIFREIRRGKSTFTEPNNRAMRVYVTRLQNKIDQSSAE